MARFPDRFLEELRAALPVSVVVQKRMKLRREGAKGEWVAVDNKSFTVSDQKQIWHDFGNKVGNATGDIFAFEMEHGGGTFHEVVERLAREAGIPLPADTGPSHARKQHGGPVPRANGAGDHGSNGADGPPHGPSGAGPRDEPRKIVATYDYESADSALNYQVCRLEWIEGGKKKKSFLQRRPVDGRPDEWAWGLKAGEYVRGGNGDWYIVTEDRAHWSGDRVTLDDVAHGLYRFVQLREELAQDPDDRRTTFLPEGERKVDVHTEWGIVATCSSGGARHWLPHHAQELLGADVVIEADNDKAGREGAEKKAASLRGLASRVRVLDWGTVWPECPPKGDIVDFKNAGHGSAEFWKIVESLKDWTPSIPESKHGAVRFADLDRPGRQRLQWLVKGLLTRGDVSVWYGHPGCGKSYLVTDAAFAISRGISWFGKKVRRGVVIYQAGEGGVGFEDRMRAYRQVHGVASISETFVMWPDRVNLYADDKSVEAMIEEAKAWASYFDLPLELLIVDTISAATTGAEENATKDMSQVIDRAWKFAKATGAHVAMIHHMPKGGSGPRGSGVLVGNVNTLIEVEKTDQFHRETEDGDTKQRPLRRFSVRKQKDGIDGESYEFTLPLVEIGRDEDGDPIPQCVVRPVNVGATSFDNRSAPAGWALLNQSGSFLMAALVRAIKKHGAYPPKDQEVKVPEMTLAVTVGDWIQMVCEMYFSNVPDDPPTEKYPYGAKLFARSKKAVERTYSNYGWHDKLHLIQKDRQWVWRTTRKVAGIDEPPQPVPVRPQQPSLLAPGEDLDALRMDD